MAHVIRPAEPRDQGQLLSLWQRLMSNGTAADPRFRATKHARNVMADVVKDTWYASEPFVQTFVVEEHHQLVGFIR